MHIGKRKLAKRSGGTKLCALIIGWTGLMLAGCSILGGSPEPVTIYAPDPHVPADPAWPHVSWQLSMASASAARIVDSARIAVRPTPGEIEVYKAARWAKPPTEQLEDTILHTLEDSGKIDAVARQDSGIAAQYKLIMDLRRFDADYADGALPSATIEVNAKLMRSIDQSVVATRTFHVAEPAAGTDTNQVAQAFGQALGTITHDIAGWTLTSGDAHTREPEHSDIR
jgi:cholesterol transport system auxiliary component